MRTVLPTNEIIAYAAGFFDGEGTIQLNYYVRKNRTIFNFKTSIAQLDTRPLEFIRSYWGGTITKNKTTKVNYLHIAGDTAEIFLRDILNFSIHKKEEIKWALEFRKTMSLGKDDKGRFNELDSNIIEFRKTLCDSVTEHRRILRKNRI